MKRFKYLALAALVAFAACDEGDDDGVAPSITGTISGVVTVEGTAASGVSVQLSSGQTATTDGSGSYSFSQVPAGAYTVSISGGPSDATFSSTSKAATISSAGQVVTVNFDGTFIRTSGIFGAVRAAGNALEGVTVSIGGGMSTTTDVDGGYSFAGLRAGSYTVSISGFDAGSYTFPSTSQSVSVAAGESKSVNFSGQLVSTASISGALFLDENDKDNVFSPTLEDKLGADGVMITIFDGTIDFADTTMTDTNGDYSFTDLPPGFYAVSIVTPDTVNIPANVAFGGTSSSVNIDLDAGESESVYWPFDITQQAVTVEAFLGTDADVSATPGPRLRGLGGVAIDLYNTFANATAAGTVGRLDRDTTNAAGASTFRFMRSADISPAGGTDNIVFARFVSAPGTVTQNGETVIEIRYNAKDSLHTADDEFDFLRTSLTISFDGQTGSGTPLPGWSTALWRNDTTAATIQGGVTDTLGVSNFNESTGIAALPDTFFVRLGGTQAAANGHAFRQAPTADKGSAAGRYLRIVHDGTQPDTIDLGTEVITYLDSDILLRAHHETDDSTSIPVLTGGDNFSNSDNLDWEVFRLNNDGTKTSVRGPFAFGNSTNQGQAFAGIQGPSATGLPTGFTYEIRARSRVANQVVLNDTIAMVTLDGSAQVDTAGALMGNGGFSTFAWKYNDATITGVVRSPLPAGVDANGIKVKISPTADNIQPKLTDTTLVVAGGSYSLTGLREGPYSIMVMDSTTAGGAKIWAFFDTVGVTPGTGPGFGVNSTAYMAVRDAEGPADLDAANFQPDRMDTEVKGVIANDRDADLTTLDPNEALSGVTVELYRDSVSAATKIGSSVTDASGNFSFSGLREGSFVAKAIQPAGALVLFRRTQAGVNQDTTRVQTSAAARVAGQDAASFTGLGADFLPRWDYDNSVIQPSERPHFTFLFNNNVIEGTIVDGAAAPVQGMTVSLRRCFTAAAGSKSPPVANGVCSTFDNGFATVNVSTDASGKFSFGNLLEGNYQVTVQPTTVAGFTSSNPSTALHQVVGSADVEKLQSNYVVN